MCQLYRDGLARWFRKARDALHKDPCCDVSSGLVRCCGAVGDAGRNGYPSVSWGYERNITIILARRKHAPPGRGDAEARI